MIVADRMVIAGSQQSPDYLKLEKTRDRRPSLKAFMAVAVKSDPVGAVLRRRRFSRPFRSVQAVHIRDHSRADLFFAQTGKSFIFVPGTALRGLARNSPAIGCPAPP